MITCPNCSNPITSSGERERKGPGHESSEDAKIIAQCMNDKIGIDWNKFLTDWNQNCDRDKQGKKITATNIQVIAILETEKGRISRILGDGYSDILKHLKICPACKATLRPCSKLNIWVIIGILLLFVLVVSADSFLKLSLYCLLAFGVYFLLPRKYKVVDISDEGLRKLKQWSLRVWDY